MNKKQIKQMLKEEVNNVDIEMSSVLRATKIQTSISSETATTKPVSKPATKTTKNSRFSAMFRPALVGFCVILICVAIFGVFKPSSSKTSSAYTCYVIEATPKICVTTDDDNSVVGAFSLNSYGETLLTSENFSDVTGKNFSECVANFIETAASLGFIAESYTETEKIINVSVVNNEESYANKKCNYAKNIFENHLQNNGFSDYLVYTNFMSVDNFKETVGVEDSSNDLDKIKKSLPFYEFTSYFSNYSNNFSPAFVYENVNINNEGENRKLWHCLELQI